MPQEVTFDSANLTHFNSAALNAVICLHISSRATFRWLAALAARPLFCTSSRSLVNSAMQGGIPPPPPSGEAWGGGPAPMGDMAGAGMGEGAGAAVPGHGARAAGRGASVGQDSVW